MKLLNYVFLPTLLSAREYSWSSGSYQNITDKFRHSWQIRSMLETLVCGENIASCSFTKFDFYNALRNYAQCGKTFWIHEISWNGDPNIIQSGNFGNFGQKLNKIIQSGFHVIQNPFSRYSDLRSRVSCDSDPRIHFWLFSTLYTVATASREKNPLSSIRLKSGLTWETLAHHWTKWTLLAWKSIKRTSVSLWTRTLVHWNKGKLTRLLERRWKVVTKACSSAITLTTTAISFAELKPTQTTRTTGGMGADRRLAKSRKSLLTVWFTTCKIRLLLKKVPTMMGFITGVLLEKRLFARARKRVTEWLKKVPIFTEYVKSIRISFFFLFCFFLTDFFRIL